MCACIMHMGDLLSEVIPDGVHDHNHHRSYHLFSTDFAFCLLLPFPLFVIN